MFKRIFLIVLDSVGIGESIDAKDYDDIGTNTFKHATSNHEILNNLKEMGFYNLSYNENYKTISKYTKAHEKSNGKDSLTGHQEMMGVITESPWKVFLDGFPDELIKELENFSNRKIIGNCNASGTEIIKELGERQLETGELIVYTSADSVLQIAANTNVIPLEELYKICEKARELTMEDKWKVGRIIARPFIGMNKNDFKRTADRKDYSLNPACKTDLDILKENNFDVIGIGKISDLFNTCGITESTPEVDNKDGIELIIKTLKKDFKGLCFANLNDYDSKYGHRRDKEGYYKALKEFDDYLPNIINYLKYDDLMIITADHGNDPTYKGTDHTREDIPVIFYSKKISGNIKLDDMESFADIGATILDNFDLEIKEGKSILNSIKDI